MHCKAQLQSRGARCAECGWASNYDPRTRRREAVGRQHRRDERHDGRCLDGNRLVELLDQLLLFRCPAWHPWRAHISMSPLWPTAHLGHRSAQP
jgi:hypothetical protein